MKASIYRFLDFVDRKIGYPSVNILESATGTEVLVQGRKYLMFGSYNYLGLANNAFVKESSIKTIAQFGVGSGGVRLLTGSFTIHEELESMIATFTGHEDAITVASGFGTNSGVIPALVNLMGFSKKLFSRKAVIFSDELNHASIVDGCRLSDAKIAVYKHIDMKDLENKLRKYRGWRKLIITDGIFSMDGDIAPLDKIVEIAKKYDAMTMIDDAHAIGTIGKTGAGTAEYYKIKGLVDINMGTFSKGLGVSGGFVSCNSRIAKYLRIACRSYMFSDSLAPPLVGAVMGSLKYLIRNPQLISKLKENSDYFRAGLEELGFNTFGSKSQVVPILIGDDQKTMNFFNDLIKYGLFAPPVRWPAVPRKLGRIRFSVMATHTKSQLNQALNIVRKVAHESKIIK